MKDISWKGELEDTKSYVHIRIFCSVHASFLFSIEPGIKRIFPIIKIQLSPKSSTERSVLFPKPKLFYLP